MIQREQIMCSAYYEKTEKTIFVLKLNSTESGY